MKIKAVLRAVGVFYGGHAAGFGLTTGEDGWWFLSIRQVQTKEIETQQIGG